MFASPASSSLDELVQLRSVAGAVGRRRRASQAPIVGAAVSRRLGRGLDFGETRVYQPGDDVRMIDWRVTARTGAAHTKLFIEERERPILLVVDARSSMRFATQGIFKSVMAARLAAVVGWSAVAARDRVGGFVLTDDWHAEVRPRSGRRGLMALFRAIVQAQRRVPGRVYGSRADRVAERVSDRQSDRQSGGLPERQSGSLANNRSDADSRREGHDNAQRGVELVSGRKLEGGARQPSGQFADSLARLRHVAQPGSTVIVFSDFAGFDDDVRRALGAQLHRLDLLAVHISDPLEHSLPRAGRYELASDGAASRRISLSVDGSDEQRRQHAEYFASHRERVVDFFARGGHKHVEVSTSDALLDAATVVLSRTPATRAASRDKASESSVGAGATG